MLKSDEQSSSREVETEKVFDFTNNKQTHTYQYNAFRQRVQTVQEEKDESRTD